MKLVFSYVPILCLIFVIFLVESSVLKWVLLIGISGLIVLSKYKRIQLKNEEVEYDDRVNANISKWSLRSMYLLNTLLLVILFIDYQGIFQLNISLDMILAYLLITLCIPFYIVPVVVKQY